MKPLVPPAAAIYLAGFSAAMNVGKLPPALPELQRSMGITLFEASFLVSAFQFAGMCLGIFGGLLADRFGPRRVMATGLALLALASGAGASSGDAASLLAARTLESAGFILSVLPGPALLRRSVAAARMNLVLGIWGSYMPAGMAVALAATPWVMHAGGWPAAWRLGALMCALAAVLVLASVSRDPARTGLEPLRAGVLARDTVSTSGPWLLSLCFGCYAGQWMLVFSFLPTIYQQAGVAASAAAALTALGVAANLVGNVASGPLLQRGATRPGLLVAGALSMIVGAWVAFGSGWPFAWRYLGVLGLSAIGGLIPGTLFTTAPRFAPYPEAVSTTTGLMQQGASIGQVIAPPVAAAVATASGGWERTWWVTGVLACANLVVAVLIGRHERRLATKARKARNPVR